MKKSILLIVLMLAFNSMFANPVDVNRAKELGNMFVKANFAQKQNSDLELIYTVNSEFGEPCFYVFNVSDHGFVMISASDNARPILGYSEEGALDLNNLPPGLGFMMDIYKESITHAIDNFSSATPTVAAEWKSLENTGKVKPHLRGQAVGPLCTTKWNQSWPYNYYCPEQSASWSSNGHVVVGCVATAMGQLLKYWNYPTVGNGSHSYNAQLYGMQSANFGETTYDWANMPDELSANSPQVEIDAVATLCYHLGVSVDMQYDVDGNGSGAFSEDVPYAMQQYFRYAPCTMTPFTNNYQAWMTNLKKAIDMRHPVYYGGCSNDGCHAFVCDGYDENELYHFNYGWGGSGDGYFAPNAIEYSVRQVVAMFDLMPLDVYNVTAKAPTNFAVVPADNNALSATLTWVNPTKTISNATLSEIKKVVIERNGIVITEIENASLGESMTYVDNEVPCFGNYEYTVYVLNDDAHGEIATVENVFFGPTCEWQLMLQSSAFQGMRGASVSVSDAAGNTFYEATTTSSSLATLNVSMPLGRAQFLWHPHDDNQPEYNLTIIIKDSEGQTVYNYTGVSTELAGGVFYNANNSCGNDVQCEAPSAMLAESEVGSVSLTWTGVGNPGYGYNVYRDGLLIALTQETSYVDVEPSMGGHCYFITSLCENGESAESNEACGIATEGCDPATDLWYEYTSNNKVKLHWSAPENEELSGYYIMRKIGEDGEWVRVKVLGANKIDYTDNSAMTDGVTYYYRVLAYYQDTDCLSAPAKSRDNEYEYHVRVDYTVGIEDVNAGKVGVYPNPADDKLTVKAQDIQNVSVINMMGQKVYETSVNSDNVNIDMTDFPAGIYMIQVTTDEYEVTKRVSVVH